jgi:hypothetical protein
MSDEWNAEEIRRMLWLRAVEWCNWPAYLSLVAVPFLLLAFTWWKVILGVFVANTLWAPFRHRIHNLRVANSAALVVAKGQYVAMAGCSIVQAFHRHWGLALLSAAWPLLGGLVSFPGGKIGIIEVNFASELGMIPREQQFDGDELTPEE